MSYVDRIRDRVRGSAVRRTSGHEVPDSPEDLPLDHQLTFRRNCDEEWKFRDDRIFINDTDVEEMVEYKSRDVRLWCGVSEALTEYKNIVGQKGLYSKSQLIARADAIQDKILNNMKKLYDEKVNGFYLSFGDGEVLLNNFNVRAFLAMYHMRPTEKARCFLVGLKSKLALILINKNGTPQYERVHRVIESLYEEVLDALAVAPIEARCLSAAPRDKHI